VGYTEAAVSSNEAVKECSSWRAIPWAISSKVPGNELRNSIVKNLTRDSMKRLTAIAMVAGIAGTAFAQSGGGTDAKPGKPAANSPTDLLDHETTQEQDKQLYDDSELASGDSAPDIQLTPLAKSSLGKPVKLSSLYKEKPVVVLMGSCTCGMTTGNVPGLEKLYKEYGDRVHFAFVYMKDAHPSPNKTVEFDGKKFQLTQPKTLSHRVDLARYLIGKTGLTLPVYIDDMNGSGRKAFAGFHNAAFVINTDGKLVLAEKYKYEVASLKKAIVELQNTN
jgi:hypothetical protein